MPPSTSSRSTTTFGPRPTASDAERGVGGEAWEIHGGGFYQVLKYRLTPPTIPQPLYWFKWEAYTTWLSGFALMVFLYYFNADTYLIDPSVADLSTAAAIAISIGGLVLAWVVYDGLCRVVRSELVLAALILALTTLAAWGRASSSAAGPSTYRSAPCSGRSWPPTSSS